jgi:hypothetical protein
MRRVAAAQSGIRRLAFAVAFVAFEVLAARAAVHVLFLRDRLMPGGTTRRRCSMAILQRILCQWGRTVATSFRNGARCRA